MTAGSGLTVRADGLWDEFMDWMLELIMTRLECGPQSLPDDVPVAMAMVADCYLTGGLTEMTIDERADFLLAVIDAEQLTKEAPESVPTEIQEKLLTALRLMLAEAVVQQ